MKFLLALPILILMAIEQAMILRIAQRQMARRSQPPVTCENLRDHARFSP